MSTEAQDPRLSPPTTPRLRKEDAEQRARNTLDVYLEPASRDREDEPAGDPDEADGLEHAHRETSRGRIAGGLESITRLVRGQV